MDKREEYWLYFCNHPAVWGGQKYTAKRLAKIKPFVLNDASLWHNVLVCHDGANQTPEQLQSNRHGVFEHCFQAFVKAIDKIDEMKSVQIGQEH